MATKITIEQKIDALTNIVEKGFAAVAEDLSKLATKEQLLGLQTQANSIEQQLRETKIEVRLGALEEKVFGAPRR
jgi:phosphosulfolactate synthase (CoM biosynthesis protein A)